MTEKLSDPSAFAVGGVSGRYHADASNDTSQYLNHDQWREAVRQQKLIEDARRQGYDSGYVAGYAQGYAHAVEESYPELVDTSGSD